MSVVAESGFGKSVLLGSAGKDMLILSLDPEGADSAFYQGSTADEWVIRDMDTLYEAYRYLRDKGCKEYKYVSVDSAPEAQKIMQLDWLEKNKDRAKGRHPDVLGMDGYQITQNQFIKFVKQMNDLPMHTIYTAKPLELYDGEGEIYYLPNIHGQKGDIARDFMGYMKIQGFGTYVEKKIKGTDRTKLCRRFWFTPHGPYKGKDRTDALGQYLDDPTLPLIVQMVDEKAAASKAAATRPAAKKAATTKKTAAPRRATRP
jgi:hypothetical protein